MRLSEFLCDALIRVIRKITPTGKGMWQLAQMAVRTIDDKAILRERETIDGFKMEIRLSCYPDLPMYYGVYEIPTIRLIHRLLSAGDVAIDVGANIGYMALHMAECVKSAGHVWAFEPVPPTRERLIHNVNNNKCTQVTVMPNAVGEKADDTVDIYLPIEGENAHSLSSLSNFTESVKFSVNMVRLDDVVKEKVRLIKIDVEGGELSVLKGAQEIIAKYAPYIIFEYNKEALLRFNTKLQDIFDAVILTQTPYEAFNIDGGMKRINMKKVQNVNKGKASVNILLSPVLGGV